MNSGPGQRPGVVGIWTILQVAGIMIWIAGFVIAFYFLSFTKKSQTTLQNNGQVVGLILTALAYLLIIYSMIRHSPDSRSAARSRPAFGVLWSVLNAYSGWFSDFAGRRRLALVGTAMGVMTPLLFLWFTTTPKNVFLGIALAALWGLGTGVYYGITEVVPGDVARLASRGALIGTFRFFRDTGNVIAPLIFTGILLLPKKQFGSEINLYGLTLWATAVMMLITLGVVWFVMRETFQPSPPEEAVVVTPTAAPAS